MNIQLPSFLFFNYLLGGVATLPTSEGCIGNGLGSGLGDGLGIGMISGPKGTSVDRGLASMM